MKNRFVPVSDDEPNYMKILYAPTHMNMGNYFIGVGLGFFYFNFKESNKKFPKTFVSLLDENFRYCLDLTQSFKISVDSQSLVLVCLNRNFEHAFELSLLQL